jgi:hypothetical protein
MAEAMAVEATDFLAEAIAAQAILVRCLHEAGSLEAEWARGVASDGVVTTGAAAIGVATTGMAAIGVATTGAAAIGVATAGVATAIGVTGIIIITTSSSSAISAFRGGGAGVGTGDIRITVMATDIHMAMATDPGMDMTAAMATRMRVTTGATTAARVMEMPIPHIPGWESYNADLRGPGITLALSMESWGLRPGKQFALTSATMGMEAN